MYFDCSQGLVGVFDAVFPILEIVIRRQCVTLFRHSRMIVHLWRITIALIIDQILGTKRIILVCELSCKEILVN